MGAMVVAALHRILLKKCSCYEGTVRCEREPINILFNTFICNKKPVTSSVMLALKKAHIARKKEKFNINAYEHLK